MAYRLNKEKPIPVSKTTAYHQQPESAVHNTMPLPQFEDPEEHYRSSWGMRIAKVLFTLVLFALASVSVAFSLLPSLDTVEVPEEIGIINREDMNLSKEEAVIYSEKVDDVLNILLIGVDETGYDGGRSDVMMIMTINSQTKEIHLTSIQRDTMAFIPLHGTYEKLNHSFAYDGAIGTMTAINQNYDMDIKNFVVFDFAALKKLVDSVGGVVVNIDENEYYDMQVSQEPAPGVGDQLLNGDQALIYARVRYNSGGDAGRNERQREILKYVFQQAKQMSLTQLTSMATNILPAIKTSYDYGGVVEMLKYFETIKSGAEIVEHGFPFEQTSLMYDGLSYIVPVTASRNVTELHRVLFNYDNYVPSNRAEEYSQFISQITGIY